MVGVVGGVDPTGAAGLSGVWLLARVLLMLVGWGPSVLGGGSALCPGCVGGCAGGTLGVGGAGGGGVGGVASGWRGLRWSLWD